MNQRLLVSSILVALTASLPFGVAHAQNADAETAQGQDSGDQHEKKDKNDVQELKAITVTGSLIPQVELETASPVVTITAEQIKAQGFGNVYDALRAQPLATGSVQDAQFQGGFTQGAKTLSLLGLDPGFTLTLIDGHPLADYPLQFNGASNVVDLSNLPVGMIDRIDILPGNQSAVYGSSAIAGVINIILKKKVDGVDLNVRVGSFDQGGGRSQRLELTGGHSWGDSIDLTYGLQVSNTDPIWGFQRDLTASNNANPDPTMRYGSRTFLYSYLDSHGRPQYLDPGAATCAPLTGQFGGTTQYDTRPGRGSYCGSRNETGYGTIQNQSKQIAGYLRGEDRISDNVELYGTVLWNANSLRYSDGRRFWQPNLANQGSGYFFNPVTNQLESAQRIFSPEESGGLNVGENRELQRAYNTYFGVRGNLGTSDWKYDAFYDRSAYFDDTKEQWPLQAAIDSFFEQQFLGPKQGTTSGYPIYTPNVANLYKPLTPAQYASFQGLIQSQSSTDTQHLNLQVTNLDLFSLPAGSVGIAGILQVGNQYWDNPAQPELINGDFFGRTGTAGQGGRSNYAVGAELSVPILRTLTTNLSARYDDYSNDGGGGDSKFTYKLGLEYRPIESLLFRGNYATAFRAPDMSYAFGGKSGFYTSANDYYRCAVVEPTKPIDACTYSGVNVFGQHQGNRGLQSVTAKSFGYGVVWSPDNNFSIRADYYNIKIANEVQLQSVDQLLKDESACRLGQLDIHSPTCVGAIAQVNRNPGSAGIPYLLNSVLVLPINVANEHVAGIVAGLNYKFETSRFGQFMVDANYNVTLKHTFQQYPFDPVIDYLRDPFNSTEFKTIFGASLGWNLGRWSATVRGTRYGATPNYIAQTNTTRYATPGAGTLAPWILYNGSVGFKFNDAAALTFVVNNISNSPPPRDNTYSALPFYNTGDYNVYGRSYFLEFDYHFGGSK